MDRLEKLHYCMIISNNYPSSSDRLSGVLSNSNPVLTCIGLGKRAEKSSSPQRQQAKGRDDSEEEGIVSPRVGNHLWSPFECPQPWSPFYHTCHPPRHELWGCGGTLSLPRATEWDRFESLIQELDIKQPSLSPPQMVRSITDLHLSPNTVRHTSLLPLPSVNETRLTASNQLRQ